jgi:hypothetical protein
MTAYVVGDVGDIIDRGSPLLSREGMTAYVVGDEGENNPFISDAFLSNNKPF